jgi:hypothetical protein
MSAKLSQTPSTFEVNGVKYASTKLNAFQQFHVLRKLGPVIAKLGPSFLMAAPQVVTHADGSTTTTPTNIFDDMTKMAPALEALSEMSESDCDFVLHRCLAVTKRFQEPNHWVNIWHDQVKRLQFEDIDLATMMQITIHVLGESLAGFSPGVGTSFGAPLSAASGPSNSSPLPMVRTS